MAVPRRGASPDPVGEAMKDPAAYFARLRQQAEDDLEAEKQHAEAFRSQQPPTRPVSIRARPA